MKELRLIELTVEELTYDSVVINFEEHDCCSMNERGSEILISLDVLSQDSEKFRLFWSLIEDDESLNKEDVKSAQENETARVLLTLENRC